MHIAETLIVNFQQSETDSNSVKKKLLPSPIFSECKTERMTTIKFKLTLKEYIG